MKLAALAIFLSVMLLFGCTQIPPAPNGGQDGLPPAPPSGQQGQQAPPAPPADVQNPPAQPPSPPAGEQSPQINQTGNGNLALPDITVNDVIAAKYSPADTGTGTQQKLVANVGAGLWVYYDDGRQEVVVLKQNGQATINGKKIAMNSIVADNLLVIKNVQIATDNGVRTLAIGGILQDKNYVSDIPGATVRLSDLILLGGSTAKLAVEGRAVTVSEGDNFAAGGKTFKVVGIYPGITMNMRAVKIYDGTRNYTLNVGESLAKDTPY